MDVTTVELFASMLAVIALAGTSAYAVLVLLGFDPGGMVSATRRIALWLAASVAVVAMFGSLYFSEVADFVPCRL